MSKIITEQSLNKARWVASDSALDDIERIARKHDIPEIAARLVVQAGIPFEEVEAFLKPTLKNDFPNPFSMKGMGDMAEEVAIAIEENKKFAIFGDFDVDGATSSATLYRFLKSVGIDAPIYIPDRLTEGYGPNVNALKQLKEQGTEIIFILDCGTTAFDIIAAGAEMGLKIIILDHHEAEDKLPECWHIVNPKRKDDSSGLEMLAAVGVTFLACVAINNRLRDRGYYKDRSEPKLTQLLDIVALGTVCDMVPLTAANRLFVRAGLSMPIQNTGIKALMQVAGLNPPLDTGNCGYALGPRINAGSRVHKSDLGAQLLCTDDSEQANNIAWTLNDCNAKRKDIQVDMEQTAIQMVEQKNMQDDALILVGHEDFHPGLSGLVAGRLKERFGKPACVVTYVTDAGEQEGRGSGRSVAGVHIAQAFIDAREEGLLKKGGGHAMAGGFTVLPERVDELKAFLCTHVEKQLNGRDITVETNIGGVLTAGGVSVELVETLQNIIGPFGQEHPEPTFMLENVRIHKADILGGTHIRVMISDWEGGTRIKAMAFKSVDTPLGDALLSAGAKQMHIIGRLQINEWQGRKTAEMHIADAAFAQHETLAAE